MGKFESYPEANALNDNDITLYNKSTVTHKITFIRLVNLIKNKIAETGLVTTIGAGAGLVTSTGSPITATGNIKCKLKSETVSSLSSANMTITANRQYAVGLDREGYLSVNIPWTENSSYLSGTAIDINNNTISVILDNTYSSSSTVKAATANAVKSAYDNSMRKDGSNANNQVKFNSCAFTVGTRQSGSTVSYPSVSEGYNNIASQVCSHAEGYYTQSSGYGSHSEGSGTEHTNSFDPSPPTGYQSATWNISAIGNGSHAEGYTEYEEQSEITGIIQASGKGSHAEGSSCGSQGIAAIMASGEGSHAEGYANSTIIGDDCITLASGTGSHAEGVNTKALHTASHAEGKSTTASGEASHSEGSFTLASGNYSHAEGYSATANGIYSHAEGSYTTASGNYSHAEGVNTIAYSNSSHAEGRNTFASGIGSHTEGYLTATGSNYSHAGGYGVSAENTCQFVQGGFEDKFNTSNLGIGVFGISPNLDYYQQNTTITTATKGSGGTVDANIQLTLPLAKCAMYVLYTTIYDDNWSVPQQPVITNTMELISTQQESNVLPFIQTLSSTRMATPLIDNAISLTAEHPFMYHLIRIM